MAADAAVFAHQLTFEPEGHLALSRWPSVIAVLNHRRGRQVQSEQLQWKKDLATASFAGGGMQWLWGWGQPGGRLSPEPPEGAPRCADLSPARPAQTSDLQSRRGIRLCCFKSPCLLQQQLEADVLFLGETPQKHTVLALCTISCPSLRPSVCLSSPSRPLRDLRLTENAACIPRPG